ncbi:short-chain dehydrogenase [Fischerella thermalis CCMEE 5282]|uniref:short-chain dehydrogenase n=1 Tax=Fischerella thermalis TaxID=372787 RepID=UPI000C7FA111|nr:short-chain dehydrogenase [Fischerella thermalis]PMB02925.1 short-chain dehydrogenase [Fischerella thermalis CCMEE 5328]PMB14901.1 short-chain dehydrogenase [Fischerella thermalis CCMEE 5282]
MIEKPEDVANAIWSAAKNHKPEVFVGSANLSQAVYRLLSGLLQWASQQVFKNEDK